MKDFAVLKFIDHFKPLYEKSGINYPIMRKIVQLKLTLDGRRIPASMVNYKQKKDRNYFVYSLGLYAFLGLFCMMSIFLKAPMFYKMNFLFGITIFFIMITMVSDFSSILLDINDRNILFTKPIDNKTLNAAKITHISIYIFSIIIAFTGLSLIAGTIRYGILFFIIFLISLILISAFVIFFTSLLYALILKFFDGEKLKDIINYFQIAISIVMIVGYQFMGRIFDIVDAKVSYTLHFWNCFIPSAWFSALFSFILGNDHSSYMIGLCLLAVIVPAFSLIIYSKAVVPYFERSLQKLNNDSSEKAKSAERKMQREIKISRIFSRKPKENLFYRFTKDMMSTERKFKLRFYPSLAMGFIFPFIFIFQFAFTKHGESFSAVFSQIRSGKSYLFIYLSALMLGTGISTIIFSDKYKAAWIYKVIPIDSLSDIMKGTYKAFFVKYILNLNIISYIIFVLIYGPRILPDLVLVFLNTILISMVSFKILTKCFPFYKPFPTTQNAEYIGISFLVIFALLLEAGVHFALTFTRFGIYINMAAVAAVIFLIRKWTFNITWKDINNNPL